jgi:nitrous oxide reductase accessory protein NosL
VEFVQWLLHNGLVGRADATQCAPAASWGKPGIGNWVEAHHAVFVIGSRLKGGMGADQAVPFSDRSTAEKFASEQGGRIVSFGDLPRDYILSAGTAIGVLPEASGPTGAAQKRQCKFITLIGMKRNG